MSYRMGRLRAAGLICLTSLLATISFAESKIENGVARLRAATGGSARVETAAATGTARLVVIDPDSLASNRAPAQGATPEMRARAFLATYGDVFGIRDADAELMHTSTRVDPLGATHVSFSQMHRGVPVFGAVLRAHYDEAGRLHAANGAFVPELELVTTPGLSSFAAEPLARAVHKGGVELAMLGARLVVFRTNLARGVPGTDHLAWEIELEGFGVHEDVYVDAHDGRILDRIQKLHDAIDREIYTSEFTGANLVWQEGDTAPTGDDEIDHLIDYALDTYNLFSGLTNGAFLSWDGSDAVMSSVANATTLNCPNAVWRGNRTEFCTGVTGDDVVAHEWGHAYTDATHGLIYQWQSGALNESYSDIWGETVDLLNGAGTDSPASIRQPDGCSTAGGGARSVLEVTAPIGIAGSYPSGGSTFDPVGASDLTAPLELADDATGTSSDACEALVGFTPGNILLADRGNCAFVLKAQNAEAAGAVAVIVANNVDGILQMSGSGSVGIPSVMVLQTDGQTLRDALPGVTVRLQNIPATDPSLRWVIGDDNPGFGGPIRDMWNPGCFQDASKISEPNYVCSTADSGGVHSNSSIPNHTYALVVDGGTYNGVTVSGIGLTRAARIYWRAQSVYQVPTTGFVDHADMLGLACQDLIGAMLYELNTDTPVAVTSSQVISSDDCDQIALAVMATEMTDEPPCSFAPMLAPDAPPVCGGGARQSVFSTDWESGLAGWTAGTREVANQATFDTPDWAVVTSLPAERIGSAAFVNDLAIGDCNADTESGVLYLQSPAIVLPPGITDPSLRFDHWVSTEANYDGGNLKISVNGGPFALVPGSAFTFNPYPTTLAAPANNTNPLAGEESFTGSDGGSLLGSWGQSQVELSGFAGSGDTVQLRFEMGLDGCSGTIGWYVDEVELYACSCLSGSPLAWYDDLDGDTFGNPVSAAFFCDAPAGAVASGGDCDDTNGNAWASPGAATGLRFGADVVTMSWSRPDVPGGNSLAYDLMRANDARGFGAAQCFDTGAATTYDELASPPAGTGWYFLPRARNGCPAAGSLGLDSDGFERTGTTCP